jgi:hypothetical protein
MPRRSAPARFVFAWLRRRDRRRTGSERTNTGTSRQADYLRGTRHPLPWCDRCDEQLIGSVYHTDSFDAHGYWKGPGPHLGPLSATRLMVANLATTTESPRPPGSAGFLPPRTIASAFSSARRARVQWRPADRGDLRGARDRIRPRAIAHGAWVWLPRHFPNHERRAISSHRFWPRCTSALDLQPAGAAVGGWVPSRRQTRSQSTSPDTGLGHGSLVRGSIRTPPLGSKGTAARLCGSAVLAVVSVEQQAASGGEAGFPAIPLGADARGRFHHSGTGRLAAVYTARTSLTTFWILRRR